VCLAEGKLKPVKVRMKVRSSASQELIIGIFSRIIDSTCGSVMVFRHEDSNDIFTSHIKDALELVVEFEKGLIPKCILTA
jgi:hypothetical protein